MAKIKRGKNGRIIFTKEMKKDYTILVPDMLPIHFEIMKYVFLNEGYKMELLRTEDGIVVIDEVLMEEYLYSVVPSEMPATVTGYSTR